MGHLQSRLCSSLKQKINNMSGETDLKTLLRSLSPKLLEPRYVFCTIASGQYGDGREAMPIASFQEPEGLTLVVTVENAGACGLDYQGVFRCISLQVHSSLEAVGLTAIVSGKLAAYEISANVIAGYYHDHIFVPEQFADEALERVRNLNKL